MSEANFIDSMSDEAFGWYLTGLTDGEGCFWFGLKTTIRVFTGRPRFHWESCFSTTLRADDSSLLLSLRKRIKCGAVTLRSKNRNDNPATRWVVGSLIDLGGIIIPHFERFPLQSKKARDFIIWKEATKHMITMSQRKKGQWKRGDRMVTPEDHTFLSKLREQLSEVRIFGSNPSLIPEITKPAENISFPLWETS